MSKTYRAVVERVGRFWAVDVEGVGPTQARNLRELETMTRDLIAVMTEQAPDSFEVTYDIRLPKAAREHLARAQELREQSARANTAAAAELRQAARTLSETGMTLRDIGQALGISYQRAHQLVAG
jgi:hypothetical protein